MDKYQEYIIKYISFGVTVNGNERIDRVNLSEDKSKLTIYQGSDPTVEKFSWVVTADGNSVIESLWYFINDQWLTPDKIDINGHSHFAIGIDFNNPIEKLKICIKSNMADDIVFPLEFVRTSDEDKKKYYDRLANEKRAVYLSSASISHATGVDLVNIYFQPCCAECEKTQIELYIAKGKYASPGGGSYVACAMPLIGGEIQQLIGNFTAEDGALFKSINGLASGVYAYRLKQYNKSRELLLESDFCFFKI